MIHLIIGITFFASAFILFKANEDKTAWLSLITSALATIYWILENYVGGI